MFHPQIRHADGSAAKGVEKHAPDAATGAHDCLRASSPNEPKKHGNNQPVLLTAGTSYVGSLAKSFDDRPIISQLIKTIDTESFDGLTFNEAAADGVRTFLLTETSIFV
jgi:hypothetical protein